MQNRSRRLRLFRVPRARLSRASSMELAPCAVGRGVGACGDAAAPRVGPRAAADTSTARALWEP
eukprot:5215100-Pleurochrysis_carterae.AAC.1